MGVPDPGFDIAAPPFDTSLGTLTGFSLEYKGVIEPSGQYALNNPFPGQGMSQFPITMTPSIFIHPPMQRSLFLNPITLTFVCYGGSRYCNSAPDFSGPIPTFDVVQSLPLDDALPGPGGIPFYIVGGIDLPFRPASLPTVDYTTDYSRLASMLTLNFTYTPVPEPASLALLLVGAVGVIGIGRRKRAATSS